MWRVHMRNIGVFPINDYLPATGDIQVAKALYVPGEFRFVDVRHVSSSLI